MTGGDRIEQLERLQKLRDTGALEAEFAREKARILTEGPAAARGRFPLAGVLIASGVLVVVVAAFALTIRPEPPARPARTRVASGPAALPQPAPTNALSPAEALASAFNAATGHSAGFTSATDEGEKTTKPLRLLELSFGPVLLTSTELKDGCHACAGAIGVYYLERADTSFRVKHRWPKAVQGWGWGAAPDPWSLTDRFTSYPAIYSEGDYMGQGITCGSATLTELRPEGPVESDLIALSYSNVGNVDDTTGRTFGDEPARDVEGKITNIVKDQSFEVRVTGAEHFSEHYVRKGGKFVRTTKESRLSC